MTTKVVSDEQLGKLARRQNDLFRRVKDGTLPVDRVLDDIQCLIEGRTWQKREWPIWKTVTIGGKSKDELLAELEAKGFPVSDWAKDMIAQGAFLTTTEIREIDLVVVTVRDLGFTKGATLWEIWAKTKELGLELCPAEVGLHLRLVYADQPFREDLLVIMKPHYGSDGYPLMFSVYHNLKGDCLDAFGARPECGEDPGTRILLALPRNPAEAPTEEPTDAPKNADGSYKVWKTITIGGKTKDDIIAEFGAKGTSVNDLVTIMTMMDRKTFTLATAPRDVDLVVVTVKKLGFPKGTNTRNICSKAKELGLELCPAEVGLRLRLAYNDQPPRENLWVAIERITGSVCLDVLKVGYDGVDHSFDHDVAKSADEWKPGTRLVFVLPRKPTGQTYD